MIIQQKLHKEHLENISKTLSNQKSTFKKEERSPKIENEQKYEQNIGVINENDVQGMPPMNFGTPTTQA